MKKMLVTKEVGFMCDNEYVTDRETGKVYRHISSDMSHDEMVELASQGRLAIMLDDENEEDAKLINKLLGERTQRL